MYINASVFRKIENTLWKNLPESRHYDDIRRKLFQIFHTCIFPDFYRLEYFQSMGNRTFLYRWKLHGIPASLWFVRLCNHKHNLVSGFYDLFQCIHRKIRCSHKNYFHIIPLPAPHNSHHEVRLLLFLYTYVHPDDPVHGKCSVPSDLRLLLPTHSCPDHKILLLHGSDV